MFVLKNEGRRKKKKKFFFFLGLAGPCQPFGKIMSFFFLKEKKNFLFLSFQGCGGFGFWSMTSKKFAFSHHSWTNTYKTN